MVIGGRWIVFFWQLGFAKNTQKPSKNLEAAHVDRFFFFFFRLTHPTIYLTWFGLVHPITLSTCAAKKRLFYLNNAQCRIETWFNFQGSISLHFFLQTCIVDFLTFDKHLIHMYIYINVCICMVYICSYISICICKYTYVCVLMYVYTMRTPWKTNYIYMQPFSYF